MKTLLCAKNGINKTNPLGYESNPRLRSIPDLGEDINGGGEFGTGTSLPIPNSVGVILFSLLAYMLKIAVKQKRLLSQKSNCFF